MVGGEHRALLGESGYNGNESHLLDRFVADPTGKPPLCDPDRFDQVLESMVADHAPRVFAIVQEYGDRVDARIAAWGIAFDDRAEVIDTDGCLRMGLHTPEEALFGFHVGTHIHPRLIWFNPHATTPDDEDTENADID